MENTKLIDVTPDNVNDTGIYCIKDKKAEGSQAKISWFKKRYDEGLRIKLAIDHEDTQIGFIEYTPSEVAWRPIEADNYLFIHCIVIFSKKVRNKNVGSDLIKACEQDALASNKSGICVMTSEGSWMANKSIFANNGFAEVGQLERFELMAKKLDDRSPTPYLINWKEQQAKYSGWHLVYADQCPWHEKSIHALTASAKAHGIDLKITKLNNPSEAKKAPSGFGTFSLLRDGRLIEDHYLSKTRFENILRKELSKHF
ncbi:GNAT family N-acetyltransferase [Fulvivirgaceae bacterium BMA10]|uniref:GNAT family N-acetyltransferase n=1 Tax=Splendidivirga corallicola TaxID=3051826 RepID=A0ABT8KJP9_9BACT|nr:GNAT family N-acetyltransferase [Fulvivirgaceae bacterium BMA10]